jgi:hypothetical protein
VKFNKIRKEKFIFPILKQIGSYGCKPIAFIKKVSNCASPFIFFLITTALVLGGCTSHKPQRMANQARITSRQVLKDSKKERKEMRRFSIENHKDDRFNVASIEFDDRGQFWDRRQYDQLIEDIKKTYRNSKEGVQVIVFVHGWNHSAAVCDSYLTCFREMLAYFAKERNDNGRPVYGVYIGWRGKSSKISLLHPFTYWERKAAAHRIGNGDVVELLMTLEMLHRSEFSKHNSKTRLTVIGHSFGCALIFSAISASYKMKLASSIAKNENSDGLSGTLTLLINPAFEAMHYQGIAEMLRRQKKSCAEKNPHSRLPVLVTVQSERDIPNRLFFPVGQSLGVLFQHCRDDKQLKQMTTTLGYYTPFKTHRLVLNPGVPKNVHRKKTPCSCNFKLTNYLNTLEKNNSELTRLNPPNKYSFMVVRADRNVIGGHGKIWSLPFVDFMVNLIENTDELITEFKKKEANKGDK